MVTKGNYSIKGAITLPKYTCLQVITKGLVLIQKYSTEAALVKVVMLYNCVVVTANAKHEHIYY